MNYLKLYVKICRKSMSNDILPNIYYEKHHIFPESIYGKNNLIVHLTARTHYIVHLLLWKALRKRYGSNHSNTRKMAMAFHWMIYGKGDTKRDPCHKSYLYDIARISASESKLGKPRIDMLGKKYFGADDETIRLGIEKMRIKKTGKKKVHSFNVSAADFDTMISRCEMIKNAGFEKGSYAFLIDGITAGWMAVQTIRRKYPEVFIHFHRASHAAYTREENPFGFSVLVMAKFARLAGASGIHTGTAGVGKMSGSPYEDVTAANNILSLIGKGHFFSQSWGKIPETDKDFISLVHKDHAHHVTLEDDSWRGMKKCCPIISGGLNPTLLKPFIDVMGGVDFITTMGAGVHAHPKGTTAGATALVQACEAYLKKIDIHKYAKTHNELAEAIEFFEKNKTKIQQAESAEKN